MTGKKYQSTPDHQSGITTLDNANRRRLRKTKAGEIGGLKQ